MLWDAGMSRLPLAPLSELAKKNKTVADNAAATEAASQFWRQGVLRPVFRDGCLYFPSDESRQAGREKHLALLQEVSVSR